MRTGLYISGVGLSLDAMIGQVRAAAEAGLDSAFFSQLTSWDVLTVLALSAQHVPGVDLGTAVVQTYPRHPLALAGQALTAQAATGNRLTLGIGPSHQQIIEGQFGHSYDRPARHVREYLSALRPLLRGEHVEYRGQTLSAAGQVDVPGAEPPSVLISALGPVMLRVAGELADGTVTVWAGPETIADHIGPGITRAASEAGRPAPRIVATVLASVTADPDGVRRQVDEQVGFAGRFPSYRALLDRQGKSGVHETVIAGDEAVVARAFRQYAEAGATELLVSPLGGEREQERTLELLASLRDET
ncbi:LLM class F420-dependent oxidoreductase [Streptosporangium roseum]|uniref:Coenzyme F420-dependent N5 N10-methylene tetrahydromethanopterin reductase-like protein n=1 Tax=Streptosporangium roseum (strain ATCC 12428 / DSM 43021 / JCM 3005 / KCTC 9067 / NCIMB 10171 / NRRL 2505 / NI 9100) TaxID=479432 RepID=D2B950_STRRD|nr:LLM class F420-dependent oxidoreductase [Streptosporangium roseum]ACZ91595.1 Coenzyme F420-dependent N5 N10-methylene tetrahydromethanopterin reductase-like protein [Streptosporangium roseum DSM 43021]